MQPRPAAERPREPGMGRRSPASPWPARPGARRSAARSVRRRPGALGFPRGIGEPSCPSRLLICMLRRARPSAGPGRRRRRREGVRGGGPAAPHALPPDSGRCNPPPAKLGGGGVPGRARVQHMAALSPGPVGGSRRACPRQSPSPIPSWSIPAFRAGRAGSPRGHLSRPQALPRPGERPHTFPRAGRAPAPGWHRTASPARLGPLHPAAFPTRCIPLTPFS